MDREVVDLSIPLSLCRVKDSPVSIQPDSHEDYFQLDKKFRYDGPRPELSEISPCRSVDVPALNPRTGSPLTGVFKRKQATPKKRLSLSDPNFINHQLITPDDKRWVGAILGNNLIVPVPFKHRRRFRRSSANSDSEEEDEAISVTEQKMEKRCISCNVTTTPLWRDAEDGTPLCNACGIRYKKYRIRCKQCWRVPKKFEKDRTSCNTCGTSLRQPAKSLKL